MSGKPIGRVRRLSQFLVFLAVFALSCAAVQAGPIFFAGRMDDGVLIRDKAVQGSCYTVQYSTISATIDGRVARVKIQETIDAPAEAIRTLCLVPLAESTDAEGVRVTCGPANGERAAVAGARFLPRAEAQKVYEMLARQMDSVKILAFSGRPAILIPAFELKGKLEMVIECQQAVQDSRGLCSLTCPTPAAEWARGPVQRLSVTAAVRSELPLRAVFSPTHAATVQRKGLTEAVARVASEPWSGSEEFRLCWVADKDDLGLRVLAYRAEGEDDGYFLLFGNPTGSAGGEKAIPKDVAFILDTSGSMRGEKIEQARAAIDYCLRQLNPGDRFNVITFGTEVRSFRDAPVAKSAESLAAALEFVEAVVAKGRTNISEALAKALAGKPREGRPQIAIFLTDGTPTAGELAPEKILESVKQANTSQTRVFVMGVGNDVNAHLLDKLAELTDGSSEYVAPSEEIDVKVATLYDRLSHPVLTGVAVSFGELRTNSVYPQKLPALFKGSEIMIAGRYRDGGRHTFTISGTLAGKPAQYVCTAELPSKPGAAANEFVAPLWAARKIGYLLQEIRLHGKSQELLEEVVRLSKVFGIVTEYTEFIASSSASLTTEEAVHEARRRVDRANTQKAGQWAVNQARNDQNLQQRAVASQAANTYMDRRGNVVAVDNVRQIGRQAFYLRDGQWVDSADAGKRKTRVVKLFSKEYFDLLRVDPQFARAQQLGWAVSLNVGEERIVVEKDGKQKSEDLRQGQGRQQHVEEETGPLEQNQMMNQQLRVNNRNVMQRAPRQQPRQAPVER